MQRRAAVNICDYIGLCRVLMQIFFVGIDLHFLPPDLKGVCVLGMGGGGGALTNFLEGR